MRNGTLYKLRFETCAGDAKDGKTVKCGLVVVHGLQKLDNNRFEVAIAATSGYYEAVREVGQR